MVQPSMFRATYWVVGTKLLDDRAFVCAESLNALIFRVTSDEGRTVDQIFMSDLILYLEESPATR